MAKQSSRQLSISAGFEALFGKEEPISAMNLTKFEMPLTRFCTDSTYVGSWDQLGMYGHGIFTYPHEVQYNGTFKDGEFHGTGVLSYPMGQQIIGEWLEGKLLSWKYKFRDGLEFEQPWKYCKYPDRRFYTTLLEGLRPAGRELITNDVVPRPIPKGCYDVGEGFYSPQHKCIISAYDENKIIRIPNEEEENWIIKNCRKAWDEPTGFRPDLYNHWTTGRKASVESILAKDESRRKRSTTASNYSRMSEVGE